MSLPGFTAEVALDLQPMPNRNTSIGNAPIRTDVLYPQFVGGHHCSWQCIPGTGCGYFCEDLPF